MIPHVAAACTRHPVLQLSLHRHREVEGYGLGFHKWEKLELPAPRSVTPEVDL